MDQNISLFVMLPHPSSSVDTTYICTNPINPNVKILHDARRLVLSGWVWSTSLSHRARRCAPYARKLYSTVLIQQMSPSMSSSWSLFSALFLAFDFPIPNTRVVSTSSAAAPWCTSPRGRSWRRYRGRAQWRRWPCRCSPGPGRGFAEVLCLQERFHGPRRVFN